MKRRNRFKNFVNTINQSFNLLKWIVVIGISLALIYNLDSVFNLFGKVFNDASNIIIIFLVIALLAALFLPNKKKG
jgi:uncharacterized membrane protein